MILYFNIKIHNLNEAGISHGDVVFNRLPLLKNEVINPRRGFSRLARVWSDNDSYTDDIGKIMCGLEDLAGSMLVDVRLISF